MRMLTTMELLEEAGIKTETRDMSAYDGKNFECSCGEVHAFDSNTMFYWNYATTGINARMLVTCPIQPKFATLIQTKYKFVVVFDKFVSIAGTEQ